MPSYKNETCPVCGRKFTSEDDIVTCPYCGTPHHRECYNSVGRCVNIDKHGTNFAFIPSAPQEDDNSDHNDKAFVYNAQNKNDYYYYPTIENSEEKKKCVKCNAEIDKKASVCDKCGARQPSSQFGDFKSPADFNPGSAMKTGFENSTEQIDGKSVSDAADVVRTNTRRFIPKFLKNKKISWNWGAFIFGPYYLFFRKIYRQGAIFLALRLIISLVAQGLYAEPYAKFYSFISSNYDSLTTKPTDSVLNQVMDLYQAVLPMFLIIFVTNLILHVIIAAFSDSFYREKVISVLTKVDKKLEEGGMFNPNFTISDSDINLSQSDMKRLYLGKLGGTSLFAPIMAFFIYDFIVSIISSL